MACPIPSSIQGEDSEDVSVAGTGVVRGEGVVWLSEVVTVITGDKWRVGPPHQSYWWWGRCTRCQAPPLSRSETTELPNIDALSHCHFQWLSSPLNPMFLIKIDFINEMFLGCSIIYYTYSMTVYVKKSRFKPSLSIIVIIHVYTVALQHVAMTLRIQIGCSNKRGEETVAYIGDTIYT